MDHAKRRPIGSYDSNILCASCDNKIGVYDAYVKEFVSFKSSYPTRLVLVGL